MAYGRQQLRKAGQALANFDRAYSDKILDMYVDYRDPNPNQLMGMLGMFAGGTPINLGYTPAEHNQAIVKKAQISSALAKYAYPAAGLGLAHQGVSSVVQAAQSQQTEGTAGL